jgi:hypothetical protein
VSSVTDTGCCIRSEVGQTQETTVGSACECNGGNQECVGLQNLGGETSIKAELVRLRKCWEDKIYFRDIDYVMRMRGG